MKRRFSGALLVIMIAGIMLAGCGKVKVERPKLPPVEHASTVVVEVEETQDSLVDQYDHVIKVNDTEIGINNKAGYKPYVVWFQDTYGKHCDGEAYFKMDNGPISLDEAKKQDIICDYEIFEEEAILLMYVNEKKDDLPLMPLTKFLRLEFDDCLDVYSMMWWEAAVKKIGYGNEYHWVNISPRDDIAEGDFVCVRRVNYENYECGVMGSNVGKGYLFVNYDKNLEYEIIK